jgi:tape measure domain-containing protein
VAYRADIEIAVRGAGQLTNLQKQIQATSAAVDKVNRNLASRGLFANSLQNLEASVSKSNNAMRSAAAGTSAQKQAIDVYVKSLNAAEIAEKNLAAAIKTRQRELGIATKAETKAGTGGKNFGKGVGGAISNAAIGGAFPLLFGQSKTAAIGGAVGGIAGSALGPTGGFAGSLVGTLIGEKMGQGQQVKDLAADIGFSAEQTKLLSTAFQQAGKEFDKFQQSVQNIRGLSLAVNDQAKAIQLVSSLTQNYGGQIDKVTNAFTSALESGKVSQATLNQLTSQGIPIQQALADKYNVSRSAILEMAKDGKISVQDLIDTLVTLGNKGPSEIIKNKSAFDALKDAVINLGSAIGTLATNIVTALTPVFNWIAQQLTNVFNLAVAGLNAINAQLAAGRAGALNRNITSAKTAGGLFGATSEGVDQVTRGLRQVTPQKNKTGIEQNLNALKQYFAILQDIGTRDKNQGERAQKLQGVILKLQGENEAALKAIPTAKTALESFKAPSQAAPSGSSSAADKAAKAAEREAERVANIVRDRAAATEQLRLQMQYSDGIFVAETAKDPFLKMELELQQKIGEISLDYSKQINDEKAKGNSAAVKEAITQHALAKTEAERLKYAMDVKKLELKRKENYDNVLMDLDQELQLRSATTEEARNQLRIEYEMVKLKQTRLYNSDQLTAIQNRKQQLAAPKTPYETINLARGAASDELTKLLDVGNQIVTIGDAIGTSFGESFKGIISGTMTAQEALASFFQSVADAFLDMAAQIIAKWITMTILNSVLSLFPGGSKGTTSLGNANLVDVNKYSIPLPGLATGGPAMANTPYIVGEKGPELFIPGRSGTVIPNDALGGSGGVQVGAINISVQNSGENLSASAQKQIAGQVQSIVLSTLVDQRRSGGVLTR